MEKFLKSFGFATLMVMWGIAVNAQNPASGNDKASLVLNVVLDGFGDSLEASLFTQNNPPFRSQSVKISNYRFQIQTTLPAPGMYVLMIGQQGQAQQPRYFNLFLDNEPTTLVGLSTSGDYAVSEGKAPQAFRELVATFGPDFDALTQVYRNLQSAGTNQYNPDSLNQLADKYKSSIAEKVSPFLTKHNQSSVAAFLLFNIQSLDYPVATMDKWTAQVDPRAMDNIYGKEVTAKLMDERLLGYGQVAPVFVQNNADGQPVSLESFRGKYVLVDFWASWCGPCRMENPNVVSAYQRYKDKNFTVLGVSLDRDKHKWLQAIDADRLTWTHVSDLGFWNNAAAKLYKVTSIPQNYLLDPEGRIIGKNLRGPALDSFLEKVLGE